MIDEHVYGADLYAQLCWTKEESQLLKAAAGNDGRGLGRRAVRVRQGPPGMVESLGRRAE